MYTTSKTLTALTGLALMTATPATAQVTTTIEVDGGAARETTGTWVYDTIPSNSASDLADATNGLSFLLLDGNQNGDRLANLNNGVAQTNRDSPAESFFALDGNDIRLLIDLEALYELTQINTYSWHRGSRTAQNYKVYGAADPTNTAPDFTAADFQDDTALDTLGFTFIETVTTGGGDNQVGVSLGGDLGTYRYVLFDIDQASAQFGTFFGEIDIYGDPASLLGDFDGDGDVDGVDIAEMFTNFNGPGGGIPTNPDTDLDGDGDVDGVDIATLFGAFTGPLSPATVPEPTSLALLGFGGLVMARRRRG